MYPTLRITIALAIKEAKLAIGANFALKKLEKIRVATSAADKADIASKAMERIGTKNVMLPTFMRAAMVRFSGLPTETPDVKPPVKGKGKGKGKAKAK